MRKIILAIIVFTCLIKDVVTAQHWSTLGEGMSNVPYYGEAWVNSIVSYNGEVYAGGVFDTAGGVAANRIAKWNGTGWSAVGGGVILNGGPNGHVRTMIVYGGELYVGGYFDSAGSIAAKNIAKWNGTSWSTVGTGVNNVIIDFVEYNGHLYAGGAFDTAGGVAANRIAKWNGTNWAPVGDGIDLDRYVYHPTSVYALAVNNGILYAGGAFDTAGSVPANNIAQWDGTSWSALGDGVYYGTVYSLAAYNGNVFAGGDFGGAGDTYASGIANWDGISWSALGSGTGGGVYAMSVYNEVLYVGGGFWTAGDIPAYGLAKWDGTYWSHVGQGMNHNVYALCTVDSSLYIGGHFTYADTLPANRIAKWTGNCLSPPQPGIINGNDTVCNSSTQTYFVNQVPGATSYTWVLPMDWPGYSNTDSITTIPYYDGEFNISVWANNSCGNSPIQTILINVLGPITTPGYIAGNTTVCRGSTQTYSIEPIPSITEYSWTLPAGWTGSSTSSSITVNAGDNGGAISVKGNHNCGSFEVFLNVSVDSILAPPGGIAGNVFAFAGQWEHYSVNALNANIGYSWSLPGGGSISSIQNNNHADVFWKLPGTYQLSVSTANKCGPGGDRTLIVKVAALYEKNPFDLQIFPNPSAGQFYLKAKRIQDKAIRVEILATTGQLIYRGENRRGSNDYTQFFDLKKLPQGVYVMRIIIGGNTYTKRIMIRD
jgi:hypothetical protein